MLDTVESVDISLPEFRELNRYEDRCDVCGAQAFILATHLGSGSELVFCGHHGRENIAGLVSQGFAISDETDKINDKPSVSASEE